MGSVMLDELNQGYLFISYSLNMKSKSIKLLEEIIRELPFNFGV